jgi:hypothetical protein
MRSDRRHSREPEHQAPVLRRREDRVDDVGEQNPPDDHQLVERRDPPALFRRGDLREVERHNHRGSADGEAEDEPRGDEDTDGRGERREQRADGEHGGRDHDQQPRRSDSRPADAEPTVAPSNRAATIAPWRNDVSMKSFGMNRIAPEMTPVSYPNRRPPSAPNT